MPATERKLRVLVIAEACNPEWVSVPLVGWSHARALLQRVDGHLVTQIRNRPALERAGLVEGRDFTAIDSEAVAKPIYKLASLLRGGEGKGWTTMTALASLTYPYFEWLVWRRFGKAIRRGEYDAVHRVTPLSPTAPSLLARRCARAGVPFVMGPLNGGIPWPREFDAARREEKEWLSYVRGIYKLLPGNRSTRKHAAAIIVGSKATFDQEPAQHRHKCVYIPENAIDPSRFALRRTRSVELPLRVVFVGRLVPYKGADMLLEAAADLVRAGKVRVSIVGDGPQRPQLQEYIDREGLAAGVDLAGWVEHARLQQKLVDMDLLAFPSIREFGGAVALEAIAVGLVPAVVAYGGPGELVTPETGFLVPMGTRAQIVASFRDVLERIVADPAILDQRAERAYERAWQLFTWDAKAAQVLQVLRWVTGKGPQPRFSCPLQPADAEHAAAPANTAAAAASVVAAPADAIAAAATLPPVAHAA
jgi:glycosyltransferase involved in cell wall biosynthesis